MIEAVPQAQEILKIELQDRLLGSQNHDVHLYFDTFDVRRALIGMWDYVKPRGDGSLDVDFAAFDQPTALVAALLDIGCLGPVHMLPPHQAELRRHLERNDEFADARNWPRLPEDAFFDAMDVLRSSDYRGRAASLSGLSDHEVGALVREHADNAPLLFKVVQCVRLTWWRRLREWEHKNQLRLEAPGFDTAQLIGRKEFPAALEAVEKERDGGPSYNNFADAVSLVALVQRVEEFRDGSRVVPRFYDSHGTFAKAAARAGLDRKLRISTIPALDTPVLVGSSYFTYKASFRVDTSNEMQQLSRQLNDALVVMPDAPTGSKTWLQIVDEGLRGSVRHLQQLNFLRDIWLPTSALPELQDLVRRLRQETPETRSAEYREAVSTVIQSTRRRLDQNASEYADLSRLWSEAQRAFIKLRDELEQGMQVRELVPVRDFKLTRFGLTLSAEAAVDDIVSSLLNRELAGEALHTNDRWHQLIVAFGAAIRDPLHHADKAEIAAAVLWCVSSHKTIIKLLRPYANAIEACPVSLGLMFAAACFDAREHVDDGRNVLAALEAHAAALGLGLEESSPTVEALTAYGQLCVGLGYLHFHLWLIERSGWDWRDTGKGHGNLRPGARTRIEHAIRNAESASRAFHDAAMASDDGDVPQTLRQLEKYSQNQRLFYLLELGDPNRTEEILAAAQPMQDRDASVWMWTFDDTMARYFHFRAVWADSEEAWKNLIDSAIRRAEEANEGGPRDDIHRSFLDRLRGWHEEGFRGRLKNRPAAQ